MSSAITDIVGIGPAAASALAEHGITSLKALARSSVEKVSTVPGFSAARAAKVIAEAGALLGTASAGKSAASAAGKTAEGGKDKKSGKDKKKKKKDKKGKKNKKGKGKGRK